MLINMVTGMARLYTHLQSRAECIVLTYFVVNICANLSVIITILTFRGLVKVKAA